jgi:hypothetical protein
VLELSLERDDLVLKSVVESFEMLYSKTIGVCGTMGIEGPIGKWSVVALTESTRDGHWKVVWSCRG